MLEFCPLCDKNGSKKRIKLSQLNFEEAVWICESSECPWPFGYEDFTFVSRKIGETWSSEWDLRGPTPSKPSETRQISLNELGLDTPPVTPGSGSGSEVIQKDSTFVENTCSATSPSLSPNSLVQTKGTHPGPETSLDKCGRSYNSECGSTDGGSPGTRSSGENRLSVALSAGQGIAEEKKPSKFKSDFSLVDDLNFETLDKCHSSSQRFSEACDAAEALTESVFNVGKPSEDKLSGLYDNGDCHESTVKCKKWLSDNTKGTVLGDHCYSSPESSRIGSRPQRGSTESLTNKKLPRVKSIKKANVKLFGAFRSNSTYSEESSSPSLTSTATVDDSDKKRVEDEGNAILTSLRDEVSSSVEACVTVPWSTDHGDVKKETIVKVDPKPERPVDDKPVVLIRIKAEDLKSIRGTRIVQTPMNLNTQTENKPNHRLRKIKSEPVVDNKSMISISIKPEDLGDVRVPRIVQSALNNNAKPRIKPDHERNRNKECTYKANEKMQEPRIKPLANLADIQETKTPEKPTSNNKIELQTNSMKKPQKRTLPKNAKYQGFNFGSLKKKSKNNLSSSEESIKSSLPNLPSPDTASTCSDVTCGSECSYTTATTIDSKLDSHSKSSIGGEDVSLASSSDVKSSNTSTPEADSASDANLSLDLQVLDELMLCDDVDLPQGFADDWLVSLFD